MIRSIRENIGMMPVEFDVTGKVVFITGAGRGIGKGIAQVLAESAADIALAGCAALCCATIGAIRTEMGGS